LKRHHGLDVRHGCTDFAGSKKMSRNDIPCSIGKTLVPEKQRLVLCMEAPVTACFSCLSFFFCMIKEEM
jgi:hypothetical protein